MRYIVWIFVLLYPFIGIGQTYNALSKPNTYQNNDNPNYWKNKIPRAGYWQQDVHYIIKADIDETTDIITASQRLTYWNNSPDQLDFVYFHLYQNAFQPDAYYDNLQENNGIRPKYSVYEQQKKGTEIIKLTIAGNEVKTELDNTILKVWLDKPLKAGESIEFTIAFKTYFGGGSVRRRMKKFNSSGFTHYDGVHWYPRICVYDRKFGWTTDQHLGREFYGDFGTFDVELTFSSNYVADATGFMVNRNEMLPEELRKKLDIKNFATKPWNETASEITAYDSLAHKTWIFHAENVHDFAFTADPTYRIGEAEWNGKKCIALVREPHASGWQNAAEYTAKIIETFSNEIGMYTYHKMIVADAKDGMEYPMLTLDGGSDPGYRGLFIHEIGHNWFFGQVGNNETYRAALDEGFTQFLTAWGAEKIEGDTIVKNLPRSSYKQKYRKKELTRYRNVYYGYLRDAIKHKDPQLNTHSDAFNGAVRHGGGYGHVYYKTATMLYNLQYVLGDELFIAAMQNYFSEWKIAHPYFDDFRTSIINYTKVDLNWFFDQWLETTKTIDYGIKSIRRGTEENEFIITFKRSGRMQMPIDFNVTSRSGKTYTYHIPNTWFEKKTNATILPRWIGWDKLQPTYDASIIIPAGIDEIQIDTTNRLADINMLNNTNKFPVEFTFDHHVYNRPDNRYYELKTRPDVWYNGFDGLKAGLHMNGSYMNYKHQFDLNVWMNSGLFNQVQSNGFDYVSYRFNYNTPINNFIQGASVNFHTKFLDGLIGNSIGFEKKSNSEKSKIYAYFKSMYRPDSSDVLYLIHTDGWNPLQWNNTLNLGVSHNYKYAKGKGELNINTKSTAIGSGY
ncbi:MAG: M1 family metallopeptidase, partial [Flavobacteriales bacterium]|nr:M1 family metallopeptidase [Flavobacteriales bacterium]